MNKRAFGSLSYGMYIVATVHQDSMNGQIVNVGGQMIDNPPHIGICLNKENLTTKMILQSKAFALSVLSEEADMKIIGQFGFKSGWDTDKFFNVEYELSKNLNQPIIKDHTVSYFELKVTNKIDLGNYVYIIGKVLDADVIGEGKPMTYAYYHDVKGGLTAKSAPTYVEDNNKKNKNGDTTMKKYKCTVCGYIYDPEKGDVDSGIQPGTKFEDIPEDWVCPVCGVGKSDFEVVE